MAKLTFLGLGVMGAPMAGHLLGAGHQLTVYNRTRAKADAWLEAFGEKASTDKASTNKASTDKASTNKESASVADTPETAVSGADAVMMCLGDDPDVAAMAAKIIPAMDKGALLIDHTTASPELAQQLASDCAGAGLQFIDAPVSGGEAGAQNGALTIMCGGEAAAIAAATPLLAPYTKVITHIGPAGHGQLAKAVNQICIAGLVQGLAEGVHFAKNAGLDLDRVLSAIGGGAAQSWQMDNRAKTMGKGEYEFGFAVDWMRKDLRIALASARESGAQLPVTALVDQFYGDVQAMGGGRWDTSSLLARLQGPAKPQR